MYGRDLFTVGVRKTSFLCTNGLQTHWDIPEDTKKIEVCLSSYEPVSPDSHKFHVGDPPSSITIDPDDNESWGSEWHDTYEGFDTFLKKFVQKTGQQHGWMEVFIIG